MPYDALRTTASPNVQVLAYTVVKDYTPGGYPFLLLRHCLTRFFKTMAHITGFLTCAWVLLHGLWL